MLGGASTVVCCSLLADLNKVDAVVDTLNPHGFFGNAGPVKLFVSSHVRSWAPRSKLTSLTAHATQMMPEDCKYQANATPPQYSNQIDLVIEPGSHVRVKIMGLRSEVGVMWAIGTINGDFLGYVEPPWLFCLASG
jgi:DNA-directed RNA polymerase II subunit RPB7